MPCISEQVGWLSLIDISGPFLAASVLEEAFPQGLDKIETPRRQRLRSAYEEWRDAVDDEDPQLAEIHSAWVRMVLEDMLEYDDTILSDRRTLNDTCTYQATGQVPVSPDFAVHGDDGKLRLLVLAFPPGTDLEKPLAGDSWPASPIERATLLCRSNEVRVGLVTEGERWVIVNAPIGATSGYAGWLARLWWQEPVTLKAFQSLLGVRRCFGPKEDSLGALLDRSIAFQEEVTDTLGEQVRRAVEILVQAIGRVDQDRDGDLLKAIRPVELYEAGLTVMMRLVFTLCAEERGLLLLGDPTYDQHYAISTLRAKLREDADRYGVEVLERRHDAWSRMLAVFRAIYGGVEHETLRMPALGGSLFDPDRFPFLEGRAKDTTWREASAVPLPIDNHTVLMLLDALQVLEQRGGAHLLSYRALDVEQLGHVYEGLLEYTVAKLDRLTVGLIGSQKIRHPSIALDELESLVSQSQARAVEHLTELTGRSSAAIASALTRGGDDPALLRLIHACNGDETLARRLLPFAGLIRTDSWETMLVYRPGSFSIIPGTSRRSTGTHYTPKSLTEPIVRHTLEPLVYVGPAEGRPPREWKLRTSAELMDLKICDMAMGSAAFLVQACRFLSERLVESWSASEAMGKALSADGAVMDDSAGVDLMTKDKSDRLLIARRLIASRCLYGVDINPMAVELGKLSLWLVTMMRNRPFGFLDHALKCGDSLLGISSIKQIERFRLNPGGNQITFAMAELAKLIGETSAQRRALEALPSNDYGQIVTKSRFHLEAEARTAKIKALADCLIAFELSAPRGAQYEEQRHVASEQAGIAMGKPLSDFKAYASKQLRGRRAFHWPLEFPEVFDRGGFNAFVGNPPFLGGSRISTVFGNDYLRYLRQCFPSSHGRADLCCLFFLRAFDLLNDRGCFGLIATNTIAQADSREASLEFIVKNAGVIYRADASIAWPGGAAVFVAVVHITKAPFVGVRFLGPIECNSISPFLTTGVAESGPRPLKAQSDVAFHGSVLVGDGFILPVEEAEELLRKQPRNADVLFPYVTGKDLNATPDHAASRWVINFFDWPLNRAACSQDYQGPVAEDYPDILDIVSTRVKPGRDKLAAKSDSSAKGYVRLWWQYGRRQEALYSRIRAKASVIVRPRVSNTHAPVFYRPNIVFSDAVVVFILDHLSDFAILQSCFHEEWARKYSSTMKEDLRYSATDAFETFPFPSSLDNLDAIGRSYYETREALLRQRDEGLTKVYNRFHDTGEESADIAGLRSVQVEMDHAVATAYGWKDIDLGHGFHEATRGKRYGINESARRIILDRLLALNHQRYDEEIKNGLHEEDRPALAKIAAEPKGRPHNQGADLFEEMTDDHRKG